MLYLNSIVIKFQAYNYDYDYKKQFNENNTKEENKETTSTRPKNTVVETNGQTTNTS